METPNELPKNSRHDNETRDKLNKNGNSVDTTETTSEEEKNFLSLLSGKILTVLRDACVNTSVHGLPRVFINEKIILKLLWASTFLVASGYCAYLVILCFQAYLQYSTNTVIGFLYQSI